MPVQKGVVALFALATIWLSGCGGVLPRKEELTGSPFSTFDEAKAAYDRIELGRTSADDLVKMGYHQVETPNVTLLTYLDVIEMFVPRDSLPLSALPDSIKRCIEVKTRCSGYIVSPRLVRQERVGNIWLDFFDFRRETETTGWEVEAVFVLIDDIVVEKLWGGQPNIDKMQVVVNPLGPIQDVGGILNRAIPSIDF